MATISKKPVTKRSAKAMGVKAIAPKRKPRTAKPKQSVETLIAQNLSTVLAVFSEVFNLALDAKGVPGLHFGRNKWVSSRYGVSTSAARKWVTGECLPDIPNLVLIADDLGISVDQLIGRKPLVGGFCPVTIPMRNINSSVDASDPSNIFGAVEFGGGVLEKGLRMKHNGLEMIVVTTDAMAKTIDLNDIAFVDRTTETLEDNHIYMFGLTDRILVRRVIRNIDGTYLLRCDNTKYPDVVVRDTDIGIGKKHYPRAMMRLIGEISRVIKPVLS